MGSTYDHGLLLTRYLDMSILNVLAPDTVKHYHWYG